VVLTHILSSYLANLASSVSEKNLHKTQPDNVRLIRKSINILNETSKKLGGKCADFVTEKGVMPEENRTPTANEALLTEQLGFINKISYDIAKVTDNILAS